MVLEKNRFSIENILFENKIINNKRNFINLDEDSKNKRINTLSINLINNIHKKINNEYFSYIEASKGDITKLKDYDDLEKCIDFLYKTINYNKKNTKFYIKNCINLIKESLNILKNNKRNFKNSFINKTTLTSKYLYSTIVACIIEGTASIVSNYIIFERDNFDNLVININNDEKDISNNIFFGNMKKFIDLYTNNKLTELFNFENKGLNETAFIVTGIGIVSLITFLLLIRAVVYSIYYFRIKISEKLYELRELLILNNSTLVNNKEKEKVIEKQKKWIDNLKKIADKIDVEHTVSQYKANNDINDENSNISNNSNNNNNDILL